MVGAVLMRSRSLGETFSFYASCIPACQDSRQQGQTQGGTSQQQHTMERGLASPCLTEPACHGGPCGEAHHGNSAKAYEHTTSRRGTWLPTMRQRSVERLQGRVAGLRRVGAGAACGARPPHERDRTSPGCAEAWPAQGRAAPEAEHRRRRLPRHRGGAHEAYRGDTINQWC